MSTRLEKAVDASYGANRLGTVAAVLGSNQPELTTGPESP